MSSRVTKLLGNTKAGKGLNVSTFHTFGLKFIRQEHQFLDLKPNFSIFDYLYILRYVVKAQRVQMIINGLQHQLHLKAV